MMSPSSNERDPARWARFHDYRFNRRTGELRRSGRPIDLPQQAARLLGLLIDHAGDLVAREQIIDRLWPDSVVDYGQGMHNAVRHLRAALGDDARDPVYLETVPRQGYRWIAAMEPELASLLPASGDGAAPVAGEETRVVYCFVVVTPDQLRSLLESEAVK